ncbi:hypothetical protein TIFTF001_050708 [Ficus carica]|uniref:Uncharacterized protein n=1 Tax=Ficus carica TaxID=3494 RepID=A0AA87Z7K1_FICCA|nr:hypothetical protein TIFTF001_050708 [Ficus carica]
MTMSSTIFDDIRSKQDLDPSLVKIKKEMLEGKCEGFSVSDDGVLKLKGRLCIPKDEELRKKILGEAHNTPGEEERGENFGAIWGARAECLESQKGGRFRFAYPNPSLGLAKGKSGLIGSQKGGVRKFGIQASKPTSKP